MLAKAKSSYKITNWREYNESLVHRGDATFWLSDDVIDRWEHANDEPQVGQPSIPLRRNSKIKQHGNAANCPPLPRDEVIREIRCGGRQRWKESVGYHRWSLSETAMHRMKCCFWGNTKEPRTGKPTDRGYATQQNPQRFHPSRAASFRVELVDTVISFYYGWTMSKSKEPLPSSVTTASNPLVSRRRYFIGM